MYYLVCKDIKLVEKDKRKYAINNSKNINKFNNSICIDESGFNIDDIVNKRYSIAGTCINKLIKYKLIKEFIGIGFNNKQIFPKIELKNLTKDMVHTLEHTDNYDISDDNNTSLMEEVSDNIHDSNYPSSKSSKNIDHFIKHGVIPITRNDFIVKVKYIDNECAIPVICYLENDLNYHGIYYYLNETNKFSKYNSIISEFNLHRLKINTILYYKTSANTYGFLSCPSELVDVSISSFTLNLDSLDFEKNIQKYTYQHKFDFYSYSLYGFLNDLMDTIFKEEKYPWDLGPKYEKRIKRFVLFLFIYINKNFNNNKEVRRIGNAFSVRNFELENEIFKDDKILSQFYNYMSIIITRYKLDQADINIEKKKKEIYVIIL